MKQVQQHIEVARGLLVLIEDDAEALVKYLETTQDTPEAKLQVQQRLKARTEENLKRLDITMARLRQSAMQLVSSANPNPSL